MNEVIWIWLAVVVSTVAIFLMARKLSPETRGLIKWPFLAGVLLGFMLGLATVVTGIHSGNYCDRLEESCQ